MISELWIALALSLVDHRIIIAGINPDRQVLEKVVPERLAAANLSQYPYSCYNLFRIQQLRGDLALWLADHGVYGIDNTAAIKGFLETLLILFPKEES